MNISIYHVTLTGDAIPMRLEHFDDGAVSRYYILGTSCYMLFADFCKLRNYSLCHAGKFHKFGRRNMACVSLISSCEIRLEYDQVGRLKDPREALICDSSLADECAYTKMYFASRATNQVLSRMGLIQGGFVDIWK